MKKLIAATLCLLLVLSFAGCGKKPPEKPEKIGDATVKINGVVYCDTGKAMPVEPDESVIVNEELPLSGHVSADKITAYAFLNDQNLGEVLVCLINGEWYQFLETMPAK